MSTRPAVDLARLRRGVRIDLQDPRRPSDQQCLLRNPCALCDFNVTREMTIVTVNGNEETWASADLPSGEALPGLGRVRSRGSAQRLPSS